MSGIQKDGAVRCPKCKSANVGLAGTEEPELVKHGEAASLEEKYRCRTCGKRFSKNI
jgi:DNA-directed RNA polymerase subunit RPC12/RpoP